MVPVGRDLSVILELEAIGHNGHGTLVLEGRPQENKERRFEIAMAPKAPKTMDEIKDLSVEKWAREIDPVNSVLPGNASQAP